MKKRILSVVLAAAMLIGTAAAALMQAPAVPAQAAAGGAYISEINGEPTRTSVQGVRPIAVMIDNDRAALPHFGLAQADVVYELVNSTANNRITRLMAIYKNWDQVQKMGSTRSTRPTNILLAAEWDAVLCHDGGPFYNDPYFAAPWSTPHFSAGFTRVNNGKRYEFTEFVMSSDVSRRFAASGVPIGYTKPVGNHFNFGAANLAAKGGVPVNVVSLPFANTKSQLRYNPATQTYDYWEFGAPARDGGTNLQVTFKNVIIQNCDIHVYDRNGYLIYNCIGFNTGWYLTDGLCIPISWAKAGELTKTVYTTADGRELVVNPGKTYITLVPSDTWGQVAFQ
ncbi:MAG: DUF3048 domain-containing protein [Lachnospiraceae bacterium]|nr:DUF3048 domain-containing protein [Lachnospiraceae bacterium]